MTVVNFSIGYLELNLGLGGGVKSGSGSGRFDVRPKQKSENDQPPFDRWRRCETPDQLAEAGREGRRLYVGGLQRFLNQDDTSTQIRDLFTSKGFKFEVTSKLVSPHESKKDEPGNHNFCFVDLAPVDAAKGAISTLDGLEMWGLQIKVRITSGTSKELGERRRLYVGGLPSFTSPEAADEGVRELFAEYEVKVVSRLFPSRQERMDEEGNHHYCFVELANEEQTDSAVEALD
jgi:RNA recognition motif-containing protein